MSKIKELYTEISTDYELPDFDTFNRAFADPEKKRQLYDQLSADYELPDYETFDSQMRVGIFDAIGAAFRSNNDILPEDFVVANREGVSGLPGKVTELAATSINQLLGAVITAGQSGAQFLSTLRTGDSLAEAMVRGDRLLTEDDFSGLPSEIDFAAEVEKDEGVARVAAYLSDGNIPAASELLSGLPKDKRGIATRMIKEAQSGAFGGEAFDVNKKINPRAEAASAVNFWVEAATDPLNIPVLKIGSKLKALKKPVEAAKFKNLVKEGVEASEAIKALKLTNDELAEIEAIAALPPGASFEAGEQGIRKVGPDGRMSDGALFPEEIAAAKELLENPETVNTVDEFISIAVSKSDVEDFRGFTGAESPDEPFLGFSGVPDEEFKGFSGVDEGRIPFADPEINEELAQQVETLKVKAKEVRDVSAVSEPATKREIIKAKRLGYDEADISKMSPPEVTERVTGRVKKGSLQDAEIKAFNKENPTVSREVPGEEVYRAGIDTGKAEEFIKKKGRRYLVPGGNAPVLLQDAARAAAGRINATMRSTKTTMRKLDKLVKGSRSKYRALQTEEGLAEMDAYLKGDISRVDSTLPNEIKGVLDEMRAKIDYASGELKASGLLNEELQAIIELNQGKYVTRAFRKHNIKDFKPADAVVEQARIDFSESMPYELMSELPGVNQNRLGSMYEAGIERLEQVVNASDETLESLRLDPAAVREAAAERLDDMDALVEGRITAIVNDKVASEGFANAARIGSIPRGHLKARKNLGQTVRALMGEINDPFTNFHNSMAKIASTVENYKMLDDLKKAQEALPNDAPGKFLYSRPRNEFGVRVASKDSKTMEPLAGLYTSPEIAEAFSDLLGPGSSVGRIARTYLKLNGYAKMSKTVLSPLGVVRNFWGNIGFAMANGHNRGDFIFSSMKAVMREFGEVNFAKPGEWGDLPKSLVDQLEGQGLNSMGDLLREATERGVLKDGAYGGEVRAIMKDMHNIVEGGAELSTGFLRGIRRAEDLAGEMYSAMDDIWKMYGFMNEIHYGADLATAASRTVDLYPTYSKVPLAVKNLRKLPVGTFFSFSSEVVRVGYNSMRLAASEAKAGNYRRLVGMLGAMAFSSSVAYMARDQVAGMNAKQRNHLREFLAPWEKNANIAPLEFENGKVKFVNLTYTDPWSTIHDPLKAVAYETMQGKPFKGIGVGMQDFLEPFFNEGLLGQRIIDALRNTKAANGGAVYNKEDPYDVKSQKIMTHIAEAFEPLAVKQVGDLIRATQGEVDRYGNEYELAPMAGFGALGLKERNVDIGQAYRFSLIKINKRMADAMRIFNAEIFRESATMDDVRKALRNAEAARRDIYAEFQRKKVAALALGVKEAKLEGITFGLGRGRSAGMSKKDFGQFFNGEYMPLIPSNSMIQRGAQRHGEGFIKLIENHINKNRGQ